MWHLISFRPAVRRGGRPWFETNLDRHSLRRVGQLVQDCWEVEAPEPKTDSGVPVVDLDDDTVGVLKRHRKQQEAGCADWGMAWGDERPRVTQGDGS